MPLTELKLVVPSTHRVSKQSAINSIISAAHAILSNQLHYIAAADAIKSQFGPNIALVFRLSLPPGQPVHTTAHALYFASNMQFISDFLAAQPDGDIKFMMERLPVKTKKVGSAQQTYSSTSQYSLGKVQWKNIYDLLAVLFPA